MDAQGTELLGRPAGVAARSGAGHVLSEDLEQEAADRVSIQQQLVHLYPPVGPNRSVLMLAGS